MSQALRREHRLHRLDVTPEATVVVLPVLHRCSTSSVRRGVLRDVHQEVSDLRKFRRLELARGLVDHRRRGPPVDDAKSLVGSDVCHVAHGENSLFLLCCGGGAPLYERLIIYLLIAAVGRTWATVFLPLPTYHGTSRLLDQSRISNTTRAEPPSGAPPKLGSESPQGDKRRLRSRPPRGTWGRRDQRCCDETHASSDHG